MAGEDKLFYTIGEVAKMVDVKPYVLRYWETEFEELHPRKTPTGQRAYRKRDVEIAHTIRRLMHEEQYTIAGARKKLAELEMGEGFDQLDMFATGPGSGASSVAWGEVRQWVAAAKEILKKYEE